MPAESESQRRLMCLALSIKQGLTPKSRSPEAARIASQMSEEQLKDFCKSEVKD